MQRLKTNYMKTVVAMRKPFYVRHFKMIIKLFCGWIFLNWKRRLTLILFQIFQSSFRFQDTKGRADILKCKWYHLAFPVLFKPLIVKSWNQNTTIKKNCCISLLSSLTICNCLLLNLILTLSNISNDLGLQETSAS